MESRDTLVYCEANKPLFGYCSHNSHLSSTFLHFCAAPCTVVCQDRYTRGALRSEITAICIYLSRSRQSWMHVSCARALGIKFTPVSKVMALAKLGVSKCHNT